MTISIDDFNNDEKRELPRNGFSCTFENGVLTKVVGTGAKEYGAKLLCQVKKTAANRDMLLMKEVEDILATSTFGNKAKDDLKSLFDITDADVKTVSDPKPEPDPVIESPTEPEE